MALLLLWIHSRGDASVRAEIASALIEGVAQWTGEKGALFSAMAAPGVDLVVQTGDVVRIFPSLNLPGRVELPVLEHVDGEPPVRLLTPDERKAKAVAAMQSDATWRAHVAEERERIKGKPHVYFIQQGDSGAIKIGCSRRPGERLRTLQTGHSEPLRLLACAVGGQAQERALHDRFSSARLSGEWFNPTPELVAYVRLVADRRAL